MQFPIELRQALLRVASRNGQSWTGKTTLSDFFGSILDLKSLPSSDKRFEGAAGVHVAAYREQRRLVRRLRLE